MLGGDDNAGLPAAAAQQPQANPPPAFYTALIDRLTAPRTNTVKSIPGPNYRSGEDFDLWVVSFVDNCRATHNIAATDPQLNNICVNWVSTKLEPGPTRSTYDNLTDAVKQNWTTLKRALSDAYKDSTEEILFLSKDDAWKRNNMSLLDYKNGLLHRMDKYQGDLKNVPTEY